MADDKEIVFRKVPDMSIDHARGKIVTVTVGLERRCFQVHLQSLGPVIAKLVDESTQTVELPDDDAKAFNLFVSWRYSRDPLPRVPDLSRYVPEPQPQPQPAPKNLFGAPANGGTAANFPILATAPTLAQALAQTPAPVPAQAQAAPASLIGLPTELLFSRYTPHRVAESFSTYNHVCFQPPMSKYSPEELRLQFEKTRLSGAGATTKAAPATGTSNTFCNGPLEPVTLPPTAAPSLAPASTTVPFGLPVTAAQPAKTVAAQPAKAVAAQPAKTAATQPTKAAVDQPTKEAVVEPTKLAAQPSKGAAQPAKAAAEPAKAAPQTTKEETMIVAPLPRQPPFHGVPVFLGKRQKPASGRAQVGATRRLPGAFPSSNDTVASGSMFNVGSWFPLASASKASDSGDSALVTAHEHDEGSNSDEAGDFKPETLQSLMAAADADAEPAEEEDVTGEEDDTKGEDEKGQDEKGKGKEREDEINGEDEKKEAPPAAAPKTEVDDVRSKAEAKGKDKDVEDLERLAMPPWIPAPVAQQAAALQDTLLALVLLAEKYALWAVFNAALEAFRAGERQLARPFPSLLHVVRCHVHRRHHAKDPSWKEEDQRPPQPLDHFPDRNRYSPFRSSIAARFMYDYAYYLAVRNKLMRKYTALFSNDPRFAAEMLARLDGFLDVPGFQERGGARVAGGKGPLDEAVIVYQYPVKHNH